MSLLIPPVDRHSDVREFGLRIPLEGFLYRQVLRAKQEVQKLGDGFPLSYSKPHVTVSSIYIHMSNYRRLTEVLKHVESTKEFDFNILGVRHSARPDAEGYCTVFLELERNSLFSGIQDVIKQGLKSFVSPEHRKMPSPHITIAQCKEACVDLVIKAIKPVEFEDAFKVTRLELLSRYGRESWDWKTRHVIELAR